MSVIWHDIECGAYRADMPLWRSLARGHRGAVLDVGAGTGRIALDLARHGSQVVALDRDGRLLAELARRGADEGIAVETVVADARSFELGRRFGLILVPMQTVQLLGGGDERRRFLECARRHLEPGGLIAIAISEELELYEVAPGSAGPLPDIREVEGIVYSSQPTAVREERDAFVLERRRETVDGEGRRTVEEDVIRIDSVSADELEREGIAAGLRPIARTTIAPTSDHVGSVVVMLGG